MTSYFPNSGHDVISRRKVLPSGEYTRRVRRLPAIFLRITTYQNWNSVPGLRGCGPILSGSRVF